MLKFHNMRSRYLLKILGIIYFSALRYNANAQIAYVDPTLTAAIIAQASIEENNSNKIQELKQKIKDAQEAATLATTFINNWQQKFYKGLTEIHNNVKNAYQVLDAAKMFINIGNNYAEMVRIGNQNPIAYAFVLKIQSDIILRSTSVISVMNEIALKAGDKEVLMDAGQRMALLSKLNQELKAIEWLSVSAKYRVEYVVKNGIWNALNPFKDMVNNDVRHVKEVLDDLGNLVR